ncbi:MAG: endolytic transglycosylase MltG [Bacteroidales bacterium]|jgi:UPF0755 protein|nr:endolytic transglycosylase MltG [Bacteroidales bacterium]MCI2121215.1 endolytic transglycosylase MltG [Bacteroidales bacterium]MCI2145995.1 endolytic transglycosylase MltG [Bacteroidales bacterium]
MRRKCVRRKREAVLVAAIAVSLTVLVLAFRYYRIYYYPNTNKTVIEISKKDSYCDFLSEIRDSGLTKDFRTFDYAAGKKGLNHYLKPGHYVIKAGISNKALIRIFANGWQSPVEIVLPPYMRSFSRIASRMAGKLDADSSDFMAALLDASLRDSLGFTEASYLSMFIPDTYQMYWTATPRDLILKIKKNYDALWTEERDARASQIGLTRNEVETLASIVIEESKYEPELSKIAGVYMNRLKKNMPLQADPTVLYALGEPRPNRVLKAYLSIDSPYNTYKYKGLPPGPITTVPVSAIDAVLNYETNNYLYFCAKPTLDGSHNFATNYNQHLKYAREYQKKLNCLQKTKGN